MIQTVTLESPDPPLEAEIYESQYTFSKNSVRYNHIFFDMYRGAVNSDIWLGRPAGTCCITRIDATVNVTANNPPEANLEVDVVKRRPSPLVNASPAEIANGASFYAWFQRWRAEGYYVLKNIPTPSGDSPEFVRATTLGIESTKPVLHNRTDGTEITNPNNAQWYLTQTRPFLSFATFFANV
jgi:hypothetical protein